MVSVKTALGSKPDTKALAQTLWATTPVATRIARSGRNWIAATTRPASINAGQISFREITPRYRSPRRSESVKPDRIVDQDFLAGGGVGRPHRKLVEQT